MLCFLPILKGPPQFLELPMMLKIYRNKLIMSKYKFKLAKMYSSGSKAYLCLPGTVIVD